MTWNNGTDRISVIQRKVTAIHLVSDQYFRWSALSPRKLRAYEIGAGGTGSSPDRGTPGGAKAMTACA